MVCSYSHCVKVTQRYFFCPVLICTCINMHLYKYAPVLICTCTNTKIKNVPYIYMLFFEFVFTIFVFLELISPTNTLNFLKFC